MTLPLFGTDFSPEALDQPAPRVCPQPNASHGAREPVLRAYQHEALRLVEAADRDGCKAPLLVLPTGAGKTVVAAELMRRYAARGAASIFLAPRRELIGQTSDKLDALGLRHGVMLAEADPLAGPDCPVQVASIDTLLARVDRRGDAIRDFDLVIVDEAHLGMSEARQRLLGRWGNALRVGLTATPSRKDGLALGMLYDTLLVPTTVGRLTDDGHLVPARYYSWPTPDLRGVKTIAGDYSAQALERIALSGPELLGDIVTTWLAHAADRRTVVFATGIDHSMALSAAFCAQGVAAEHVDAQTPHAVRAGIMARFKAGKTQVLTNCFLAAYGFDAPAISCVVLARPTKSLGLYLQMLGRGLRPMDGKADCLVLDHAGCVHRHGFAADERDWTLDGKYALSEPTGATKPEKKPHECPQCHAVFRGQATCPACGFELKPKAVLVPTLDGELVEVGQRAAIDRAIQRRFYAELRGFAGVKGYKPGWAWYKYQERFGAPPPREWGRDPEVGTTSGTLGWIRSRQIRWAKSAARGAVA